ncbi:non-ribosomal peptide synthetase [Sinorhizobium meliloti]|uniref:non-ribosomal peptide synthetase n=1 Tax=Rhizobium meliloti TaxID=382 RepID=UPI000FDBA66B|nr:non-ribosomal peptide synthetase [Sinorhizobium meliloti]RVQ56044.1 amino acid adenylation domain-containing protein [Sinorhizobium meliloti]
MSRSPLTISDQIADHAERTPEKTALIFLDEQLQVAASFSYQQLMDKAAAFAGALQARRWGGQRVLLALPAGLELVAALLACFHARVIPIVTGGPTGNRARRRFQIILRDSVATAVLTDRTQESLVRQMAQENGGGTAVVEMQAIEWEATSAPILRRSPRHEGDLALIQYTSGSTGSAKGVEISHGNLMANQVAIREAFGHSADTTMVTWLPTFHDMGLMGGLLQPLFVGGCCALMAPSTFVKQPANWLRAMTLFRGTTSGGPNFAYDLCTREINEAEFSTLDLSSWAVAFNGAEPVRRETLQRFYRRFRAVGFRREAFHPCYGLAETTLFVATSKGLPSRNPAQGPLSVGRPPSSVRVAICAPEDQGECAHGHIGEILVAGPSVARGYWRNEDVSARTFVNLNLQQGSGPWLRTGDMGVIKAGELHVLGRLDETLNIRGVKLLANEIEELLERSHAGIAPSGVLVVEAPGPEARELCVVAETGARSDASTQFLVEVTEALRRTAAQKLEITLDRIYLIRRGLLPRTTSGKKVRDLAAATSGKILHVSCLTGSERPAGCPGRVVHGGGLDDLAGFLTAFLKRPVDEDVPLVNSGLDSLQTMRLAQALKARFGVRIGVADLLRGESCASIRRRMPASAAAPKQSPPNRTESPTAAASDNQTALWLAQAGSNTSGYLHVAFRTGALDHVRFSVAVSALLRRYPELDRRLVLGNDGLSFAPARSGPCQHLDDVDETTLLVCAEEQLVAGEGRTFAVLLVTRPEESIVVISAHHLVCDHWSAAVLLDALFEIYQDLPQKWPPQIRMSRSAPQGHAVVWPEERAYIESIAEAEATPFLPQRATTAPPRPLDAFVLGLGEALSERIRALAATSGATPFCLLYTLFQVLLARHFGRGSGLTAFMTANREEADSWKEVGYLATPVLTPFVYRARCPLTEMTVATSRAIAAALSSTHLPLRDLLPAVRDRRALGEVTLPALFSFQVAPGGADIGRLLLGVPGSHAVVHGHALTGITLPAALGQADLSCFALDDGNQIWLRLEVPPHRRCSHTTAELAGRFQALLESAVHSPTASVGGLQLTRPADLQQLATWSGCAGSADGQTCIHHLFEAQAARTPEVAAVRDWSQTLSYGELNARADRIARTLQARGLQPETRIGVALSRSVDLIATLLGILKAGYAYVPLEPEDPPVRKRRLIQIADVALVVHDGLVVDATAVPHVHLDDLARSDQPGPTTIAVAASALAYVLCTSGSTGEPKAVMIEHQSAVGLLRWAGHEFGDTLATVLFTTRLSFDLSVFEIFAPLACGGTCVVMRSAFDHPPADTGPALLNTVPSICQELLLRGGLPPAVRHLNLAGEKLSANLLASALASWQVTRVRNLYGPTECTTYATAATLSSRGDEPAIGRPVNGTTVYVLDEEMRQVPPEVWGELYIGGRSVARGYLADPSGTAERFVPDPFSPTPGARMYRTGDQVRWSRTGQLLFGGREDTQVKIHGARVDPGEVEAVLLEHPVVAGAVVMAVETGQTYADGPSERRLVAYLVFRSQASLSQADLRRWLRQSLPEYMVPSRFVSLSAFPLTANGKLDRQTLPAPDWTQTPHEDPPRPQDVVHELLAEIWKDVLRLEATGDDPDFFELGGHSLSATQLAARLREAFGVDVSLREIFEAPTLPAQASLIEAKRGAARSRPAVALRRRPAGAIVPLAMSQQGMWFFSYLQPADPSFNVPLAVELSGLFDRGSFEAAVNQVIARHEILRTSFPLVGDQPVQTVTPELRLPCILIDLEHLSEAERYEAGVKAMVEEASRPFDITRGPLLRCHIWKLREDRHLVLPQLHHLLTDGWSLSTLAQEVSLAYNSLRAGQPICLPELPVQYGDFALWQRQALAESLTEQLQYWTDHLRGVTASELLARRRVADAGPSMTRFELEPELLEQLQRLSRSEGVTLYMTLLAAFALLLSRYTGSDQVVIGSPVTSRPDPRVETLIGVFFNTLPLRIDLSEAPSFRQLLAQVRRVVIDAFANRDVPLQDILRGLGHKGRSLTALLTFQNFPLPRLLLADVCAERILLPPTAPKSTYHLTAWGEEGRLTLEITCADLAGCRQPAQIAKELVAMMRSLLAHPDAPTKADLSLIDTLYRAATRNRERIAVAGQHRVWSYGSLWAQILALSRHLHRVLPEHERRIALVADPGELAILGILAILATGKTYIPVNSQQPQDRIRRAVENAETRTILVDRPNLERTEAALSGLGCASLDLSALIECEPDAEAAGPPERTIPPSTEAYIIYTSGSTGGPKGVVQSHGNVRAHAEAYANSVSIGCDDRLAMVAHHSFDAGIMDLYGALLTGASLHLWDLQRSGLQGFSAWLESRRITVLHCTPSLLRNLPPCLTGGAFSVRAVVLGGEEVRPQDVALVSQLFGSRCTVHCGYGPTESTTALQEIIERPDLWRGQAVPLGQPIGGAEVFICDEQGRPTDQSVGELAIRSDHLALGYWRDSAATAAAFLPDPEGGQRRIYLTGDIAKRDAQGRFIFVQRKDHLAKVHGARVDPGEVEAVLLEHPVVAGAVVMAVETGQTYADGPSERRLVAYLVFRSQASLSQADLRRWLRQSLPEYMVPSRFVSLSAFPLTANGKLDRQTLPAPDWTQTPHEDPPRPQDVVHELLAEIWKDVLRLEATGDDPDFFELGGHSLSATQLAARLREAFGVDVSLREIFEAPTLPAQASLIEAKRGAARSRPAVALRRRPAGAIVPLAMSQQGMWFFSYLQPADPSFNVPLAVELSGLFDRGSFEAAVNQVIARHEILRTSFPLVGDQPVQTVTPELRLPCILIDLEHLSEAERYEAGVKAMVEEASRPFDITRGPLLRCHIWKLREDRHLVLLQLHHLLTDGWSLSTLAQEVSLAYNSLRAGQPICLPELPVQYGDFALWQRQALAESLTEQLQYWTDHLRGVTASELLARRRVADAGPSMTRFELEPELLEQLQRLSRSEGVTLYMTLLAAFALLLSRYTGSDQVVIGSPVTSRPDPRVETLIGVFFNTLPLRIDLSEAPSFRQLLAQVRRVVIDAFANRDVPLQDILRGLRLGRDQATTPALRALFTLQSFPNPDPRLDDLSSRVLDIVTQSTKSDWSLTVWREASRTWATLIINGQSFTDAQVANASEHYQTILTRLVDNPELSIVNLGELPYSQLHQILADWNGTTAWYREQTFDQLIAESIERYADRSAVIADGQVTSYRELGATVRQLAARLQTEGSAPGAFVPVILRSGLPLVTALQAIASTGAAFVPLSVTWPEERISKALLQLQPRLAVAGPSFARLLDALGIKRLDPETAGPASPFLPPERSLDSPAYAMFTSGSTGTPRAPTISHRGLTNRLQWMTSYFGLDAARSVIQTTRPEFDSAIWQLFWPLTNGGCVVLGGDGLEGLARLPRLIKESEATAIDFVPSALRLLLLEIGRRDAARVLASLRLIIVGSDEITTDSVRALREVAPAATIANLYGSTETTIGSIVYVVPEATADIPNPIPIGRPISNTQAVVVDVAGRLAPVGVPGELLVGGVCVGLGYLSALGGVSGPYIASPDFLGGCGRAYRTGDLARFRPDGCLDFFGRIDSRFNINGFRIDPKEIETVLTTHPAIEQAVVVRIQSNGHDSIAVAFASPERPVSHAEIRAHLARAVPRWMLPERSLRLATIPLTAGAKVDRHAVGILLEQALADRGSIPGASYKPAGHNMRRWVEHIWKRELDCDSIGSEVNFFEAGGDSLALVRIQQRVRAELQVDLSLTDLLAAPTMGSLAKLLELRTQEKKR